MPYRGENFVGLFSPHFGWKNIQNHMQKRGNNFVVRITDSERKVVQKENKRNRLVKAGGRKRGKAATYYLLNDDWESLRIVADLRGYKDKTYYNRRFNETKVFTAVQRLLQDV